jgi:hypothetical protein
MAYTFLELAHMHLVLGEMRGSTLGARRRYVELYPNRRAPNTRTFVFVDRRLRETGILRPRYVNNGRQRISRTVDNE